MIEAVVAKECTGKTATWTNSRKHAQEKPMQQGGLLYPHTHSPHLQMIEGSVSIEFFGVHTFRNHL